MIAIALVPNSPGSSAPLAGRVQSFPQLVPMFICCLRFFHNFPASRWFLSVEGSAWNAPVCSIFVRKMKKFSGQGHSPSQTPPGRSMVAVPLFKPFRRLWVRIKNGELWDFWSLNITMYHWLLKRHLHYHMIGLVHGNIQEKQGETNEQIH